MNAELNWEALRIVLRGDAQIYGRLAAGADHSAAGNAQRERYGAMGEQALKTLDSMATIEATDSSVPGLAEHTAAAPAGVIPAGTYGCWWCRNGDHANCKGTACLCAHTAAAQEKIIEATR